MGLTPIIRALQGPCLPAQLGVPLHAVDVEEHGAAGVGHVCAVDAAVPAAGQTLRRGQTGVRGCRLDKPGLSRRPCWAELTQMIQESTVPNMARSLSTACRTSSTLSSSQRSFTALK